jgi:CspA family cold shock protein
MANATVREWHDDRGWGVLDSPETPGGCWTHYSVIDTPCLGSVDGAEVSEYKVLSTGEKVEFEWERAGQDGFVYRAVVVRHRR